MLTVPDYGGVNTININNQVIYEDQSPLNDARSQPSYHPSSAQPIHSRPLHSTVKLSREKWVVEYAKYEEDDQNKM